jgi:hypothetical protein
MKLYDYYQNTVEENESMTGGWAPNYYGIFSYVINENHYKNVAEVGIGYGTHAKYILRTTQIDRLYLIDPTQYYPNDSFADDIMSTVPDVPGNHFNELYGLINNYLDEYRDKYIWYRTESLSITNDQIKDESLDCIFIDGDHTYDAVLADLTFWWKKLRVGGQILGDDYSMESVSNAVNVFAEQNGLTYDILCKEETQYPIYRFHK